MIMAASFPASRFTILEPLEQAQIYADTLAKLRDPVPRGSTNWHGREREVLALCEHFRANTSPLAASSVSNDISYFRNLGGDLEEIRSQMGL